MRNIASERADGGHFGSSAELSLFSLFFVPSYFLQMSLKHNACHTFRASEHLRWGSFRDYFLNAVSMFFQVFGE